MGRPQINPDLHERELLLARMYSLTFKTEDNHWLWTGTIQRGGYGQIGIRGKTHFVHRLSAYFFLGLDLNSDLQSNHKNRCQYKNCWNPDHLYIGTQGDNGSDVIALNSTRPYPCGHPRTTENTRYTKDRAGNIGRYCKMCNNARSLAWHHKKESTSFG
jgi:hypothetical protein